MGTILEATWTTQQYDDFESLNKRFGKDYGAYVEGEPEHIHLASKKNVPSKQLLIQFEKDHDQDFCKEFEPKLPDFVL